MLNIKYCLMERIAFKMKMFSGMKEEYKRRHYALWPDLQSLLKENGIAEYSIFLDEETDVLFGFLKIENPEKLNSLPENAVMKKWWTYMKDIMETNPDESPISIPLQEVFFMP